MVSGEVGSVWSAGRWGQWEEGVGYGHWGGVVTGEAWSVGKCGECVVLVCS